jgi:hypothetical protein
LISVVKPYAKEGQRHNLGLALSGYLHKKKFSINEAEKIFKAIFVDDEEISQRINLLDITFKKNRDDVAGLGAIREILTPSDADKVKELITNRSKLHNMTKTEVNNIFLRNRYTGSH